MTTSVTPLAITVTHRGNVGPLAARRARVKVEAVLAKTHRPVLDAHVVLDWHRDPAVERPALAEVDANLNGTHIRAMAERPTMQEAVDEMSDRLKRRIRKLEDRERDHHRRPTPPDTPRRPAPLVFRDVDDRRIVRYKTHPDVAFTPDDASYEMELLDHDFYLFRNLETGDPAVLRRVDPHSYSVDNLPDRLTETQALNRLDTTSEPLVFYIDALSGAARVLYRRYDGHYGSISLA